MPEAFNSSHLAVARARPRPFAVCVEGRAQVWVSGELDCATAPALSAALQPLAERGGTIGVDLSLLEFMDAAGINALHGAARTLGARGRVVVFGAFPKLRRLFYMTGLERVIDVVDDIAPSPRRFAT